ncbi:hypothetical protein VFJ34_08360, partial [Streptococcus sp. R4]|nr:hypothetical protein [Streptococcus agalactiae]MEC3712535.1 hypothetical protein [Streptococcus agalactiae]MEE3843987.1 hypothetical protein [Streptococcus sp. R4]
LVVGIAFKGFTYFTSNNGLITYHNFELLSDLAYPFISYDSLYYQPCGQFSAKVLPDSFKVFDGVLIPYSSFVEILS